MNLISAFEIISLAGVSLSLFATAAFEISDAKVDRFRFAKQPLAAVRSARRAITAKAEVSAAANQVAALRKVA